MRLRSAGFTLLELMVVVGVVASGAMADATSVRSEGAVGGAVFVANIGVDTVSVLDPVTHATVATIPAEHENRGAMTYNPRHDVVYLADTEGQEVISLDASAYSVVATLPVPGKPYAFTLNGEPLTWKATRR